MSALFGSALVLQVDGRPQPHDDAGPRRCRHALDFDVIVAASAISIGDVLAVFRS
jgi:hypothetical protein